jgi:hypothetical protein
VHQRAANRTESQNELTPELTPDWVVSEAAISRQLALTTVLPSRADSRWQDAFFSYAFFSY